MIPYTKLAHSPTGDPRWAECVTGFGGTLRKLWERAVEEVLSPVLTRWTHNINTGGFVQLTVLTEQDHNPDFWHSRCVPALQARWAAGMRMQKHGGGRPVKDKSGLQIRVTMQG